MALNQTPLKAHRSATAMAMNLTPLNGLREVLNKRRGLSLGQLVARWFV